jgi:hypothetical protein
MPAWPFVFYRLTVKIGTLGERLLLGEAVIQTQTERVGSALCGSCMLSRANMQRYWIIRSNESANSSPLALM